MGFLMPMYFVFLLINKEINARKKYHGLYWSEMSTVYNWADQYIVSFGPISVTAVSDKTLSEIKQYCV